MKRIICFVCLTLIAPMVSAAGPLIPLMNANVDLNDTESLQRGARTFVNYCLSCHSAEYMRYNRIAKDLKIPEQMVKDNLIFTGQKIGDVMKVSFRKEDAKNWFLGIAPPDLSVIARSRGEDWLYTFLSTFYLDAERPTGVNNLAFRDTAMPHVLWELQGWQIPMVSKPKTDGDHKNGDHRLTALKLAVPGKQTKDEYQQTVRDLVNFLVYVGEPAKLVRHRIGLWVLGFLAVLLLFTYLLKKEYWRDMH